MTGEGVTAGGLLVTGAGGMLGGAVVRAARARGAEVTAADRRALDVTDADRCRAVVAEARPGAIVHCAAYNDVDGAESEPEEALRVNRDGARHVAGAAAAVGATVLYLGTDYVFDGEAEEPYPPDAEPAPLNAYGESKLAGEEAVRDVGGEWLVVRTSWLFGRGGSNFVDTILRLGRERERLEVVADQRGRPTWTGHLAPVLLDLLDAGARGTFHAAGRGETTWHGLAGEALRRAGVGVEVVPVSSEEFPRPARRPRYSVLEISGTEEAIGREIPRWEEGLARHLEMAGLAGPGIDAPDGRPDGPGGRIGPPERRRSGSGRAEEEEDG